MPDLNTVPASPRPIPHPTSRHHSTGQIRPPSPSLNILPSNQPAVEQARRYSNASLPSPRFTPSSLSSTSNPVPTHPPPSSADTSSISGTGPLRHPRPLTAAELHSQLEKEQEAVLLRVAHNASVASNTSSTSTGTASHEQQQTPTDSGLLTGAGFSIPSSAGRRHNRTASNTSTRSLAATMGSANTSTASGLARPLATPLSRQNSSTSHRSITGTSPAGDSFSGVGYVPPSQRIPGYFPTTSSYSNTTTAGGNSHTQDSSPLAPGLVPGTARYEEALLQREQLENTMRENEALKKRIRELERMVRERRSESISTTTSTGTGVNVSVPPPPVGAGVAGPRDRPSIRAPSISEQSVAGSVGVGVPEEEVRVGESASNAGMPAPGA
ncbi:hypothetical protein ACRALDRAFT_2024086 [Sodiomyces alcalophilus JCM 7366]|uniref:uncharacterized protein n=1 Tax=Sodiomyces alcalophilus JCM 7366 TaxID=591952 RepID=UPI0039B452D0